MTRSGQAVPLPEGRLRTLRLAASPIVTQKEIALACDVVQQAVSLWESQDAIPPKHLEAVADVLGVEVAMLVRADEPSRQLAAVPDLVETDEATVMSAARATFMLSLAERAATPMTSEEIAFLRNLGSELGVDL